MNGMSSDFNCCRSLNAATIAVREINEVLLGLRLSPVSERRHDCSS